MHMMTVFRTICRWSMVRDRTSHAAREIGISAISTIQLESRNMKILKHISFAVLAIVLFSVAASAQAPSLADVGDEVYVSEADGFEIAVPKSCVSVKSTAEGHNYICDVKEGRVSVSVTLGTNVITSDKDVAAFISGFKDALMGDAGVKLLGETSAKVGDYRGAAYQMTIDGDKAMMVALVWGKFTVVISGRANAKAANSAELISEAVQSFSFVNK